MSQTCSMKPTLPGTTPVSPFSEYMDLTWAQAQELTCCLTRLYSDSVEFRKQLQGNSLLQVFLVKPLVDCGECGRRQNMHQT